VRPARRRADEKHPILKTIKMSRKSKTVG